MSNYTRGKYNEILISSLNERTSKQVRNLFAEAQKAQKLDGHGNWAFGAAFENTRNGEDYRGSSLNWDLYAIGKDHFSKRLLMIIQIRQYTRGKYTNLKKSYFLLGRNEDNTAFAHPVLSRTITNAIKKGRNPIRAVQDWIFKTDYTKILRQGDIALVPLKQSGFLKSEIAISNELLIEGSHQLIGSIYATKNNVYVRNPSLYHLPQTHPNFLNLKGFYKVISGKRANFYDFAPPTVD